MTTPPEELRTAATKLRQKLKPLLDAAADKDWTWTDFFALHGADLSLLREDEEWIALMSPAVGELLAGVLDDQARTYELWAAKEDPETAERVIFRTLLLARVINGAAV